MKFNLPIMMYNTPCFNRPKTNDTVYISLRYFTFHLYKVYETVRECNEYQNYIEGLNTYSFPACLLIISCNEGGNPSFVSRISL
jgi:hypothetical protein